MLAAGLRGLLSPALGADAPTLAFITAVVGSAILGGTGAGLYATALGAVICVYVFIQPVFAFGPMSTADAVRVVFFVAEGVIISWAIGRIRRSEKRAMESGRAALEANQKRLDTLAVVSHDLRNPLSAIESALALMRNRPDRALGERARAVIERQSAYLSHLVNDLVDSVRIEREGLKLQAESVALQAILERAVEIALPRIAERHQTLTLNARAESATISGDAVRLQQVFSNIVVNASKYTPEGGTIDVVMACDRDVATVSVQDSGVGVTPEQATRIFQPYFRVSADAHGLGLGLYIARHLVELHGGTVHVESEGLNRGSTFVIRLPVEVCSPVAVAGTS